MDGGHPYCTKTIITNNNIEVNPSYTIWVQQNNILMSTLTASFSIQVSSLINGCTLKVLPLHLLVAQGSNPHATSARAARSVHCFAQHYYGCCQRQQVMHIGILGHTNNDGVATGGCCSHLKLFFFHLNCGFQLDLKIQPYVAGTEPIFFCWKNYEKLLLGKIIFAHKSNLKLS